MKRYFLLSFVLISVTLYSAGLDPNMPPARGRIGVAIPGRGIPTPTPNAVMQPSMAPQPRARPRTTIPTANLNPNRPPQTRRIGVAVPGQGTLVPTQTNEAVVSFAAEQRTFARQIARGNAAVSASANPRQRTVTGIQPTAPAQAAPAPEPAPVHAGGDAAHRNPIPQAAAGTRMLDVINSTGNTLALFIMDNQNRTHQENLDAGTLITSVVIPNAAVSVFVQNRAACSPISLINGLKAIVVTPQTTGIQNYAIQPLVPQYDNDILVYNGSPTQQLVLLEIDMPSTGLAGYLPSFLVAAKKLTFSKQLEPQEFRLIEIPNITSHVDTHNTPTVIVPEAIRLNVPSSNTGVYTLTTGEHNSFVITAENNLVPSSQN